eukprot:824298-Amphidinium_carterae.1
MPGLVCTCTAMLARFHRCEHVLGPCYNQPVQGRSACCVICYLIYAHGWTALEVRSTSTKTPGWWDAAAK